VNCIDPTGLAFEIDIPGFFNPVMMNDFRKEPLPSEFVEQQAYMNRAVMGASTVAVAGPVVSLAAAEIVPAAIGAYPAAVGAYNGASGMTWTLYIEPWAVPAYEAAQAWIAKSLLRTAVVTYFGVTVTGKKGNVQPPARPWYSTSANPQSGKVINPLAPTTGPRVNLQQSTEGAGGNVKNTLPDALAQELKGGGSWLMTKEQFVKYAEGRSFIGRTDGQFMNSARQMNQLIKETGGDPVLLGNKLGVKWTPDTQLIRMDVIDPLRFNARLPEASMSGANNLFKPGGLTSGGVPEFVTDPLPWQQVWSTPVIPGR
jgi:hypothetical protein